MTEIATFLPKIDGKLRRKTRSIGKPIAGIISEFQQFFVFAFLF
jgi:hypothetical protein